MPDFLWRVRETRARKLALAPLLALEGPYRLGAWLHRTLYARGWLQRVDPDLQVVSVGNLSAGGSGKTPFAAWLASALARRGRKVALLSRGVGGRRTAEVSVVSDGERVLLAPRDVGDEPVLAAALAPGVPVLAGRNRVALALRAETAFACDLVVLDDGFQHHRLARELDLVCLDAGLGLGNGHALPRGPLREPASALRHADALVWTRVAVGEDPPALPGDLGERPQFCVEYPATGVRRVGAATPEPVAWLRGRRVGLLSGLARPDRLRRDVGALGARVVDERRYRDHHRFSRRDLAKLAPELDWLTTAKDAVKIPEAWVGDVRLWVLQEEVRPREPEALLAWLTAALAPERPSVQI